MMRKNTQNILHDDKNKNKYVKNILRNNIDLPVNVLFQFSSCFMPVLFPHFLPITFPFCPPRFSILFFFHIFLYIFSQFLFPFRLLYFSFFFSCFYFCCNFALEWAQFRGSCQRNIFRQAGIAIYIYAHILTH